MFESLQFADELKGFSRPEYLVILLSFVYGFSLSDQFFHFGTMIKKKDFYFETIIWSNIVTMSIIVYWYFLWRNIAEIDNSLFDFLLNLLPAFFLFVIVSLIYPNSANNDHSHKEIFLKNRKWIFILATMLVTVVMGTEWLSLGYFSAFNVGRMVHLVFLIPCIVSSRKLFRDVASVWFIVWNVLLVITSGI